MRLSRSRPRHGDFLSGVGQIRLHVRYNDTEAAGVKNSHWWIGREHKAVFENEIIEAVRQSLHAQNQNEFDNFLDMHRTIEER